jgi:ATP-binding cassette subfamily C protein
VLNECAGILQYCQECFEGLKAYTTEDGSIVTFRPDLNAERMMDSASRLEMPVFPKERFLEALDQVRLKEWVLSQPEGLDTFVGDAGGKLSGGQRQKMGIARALLCRAEYILFDEATSSVDRDSEQEIWNCIGELAQTRTLLIISHRLSTIRDADVIYVLEKGQVSQRGSHRELMALGGYYADLYNKQFETESAESVFSQ